MPNNTNVTKTATLVDNGVSGVMRYVTQSGDLSIAGMWKIQGYVDLTTSQMHTNISEFRVYANL